VTDAIGKPGQNLDRDLTLRGLALASELQELSGRTLGLGRGQMLKSSADYLAGGILQQYLEQSWIRPPTTHQPPKGSHARILFFGLLQEIQELLLCSHFIFSFQIQPGL
jgi:hypothetical protein